MSEYPDDVLWPDPEKVVGALLLPIVARPEDIGKFLIAEYVELIADHDTPFITVRERGGQIDPDDFTSYKNVEVSCWGKTRSVARSAMDRAVQLVLGSGGTEVIGALVDSAEDVTGAEEPVLENPDDRCLTRMFQLGFRPIYQD
jgi:hypothetical protein